MFAKFKGALINAVGSLDGPGLGLLPGDHRPYGSDSGKVHHVIIFLLTYVIVERGPPLKFKYTRPQFLQLNTDDEVQVTADHSIRPIIVPRDITKLPWNSGYAECINAGKSLRNEDQAAVYRSVLRSIVHPDVIGMKVADMMPTIQTSPRQAVTSHSTDASSEKVPGSAAVLNGVAVPNANGHFSDSNPIVNGVEAAEVKVNDPLTELAKSVQQLNATDLLSPSQPFPLSEFNDSSSNPHPLATTPISIQNVATGMIEESLPWTYFGIFDGHAGSAVAVTASVVLHKAIHDKLQNIADLLIAFGLEPSVVDSHCDAFQDQSDANQNAAFDSTQINRSRKTTDGCVIINHDANLPRNPSLTLLSQPGQDRLVTVDSLIIGALESAFWEVDAQIGEDKRIYRMPGGCTVLVSLFILGKLYVANAGDSRCIMCRGSKITPMSFDFTPESERERVKYLGLLKPELLGSDFTHLEYIKRPTRRDIGRKMLYRDAFMTGWCYKTITTDDMKFPLVYGEGKRSRVLATIGVTRGFGDHELKAQSSHVDIKPFLTPQPEVRVFDVANQDVQDTDVIIMGTDGLWDVTSNEQAADVVSKTLNHFPCEDEQRYRYRYISAAQDLVMASRGKQREKGKGWRTADNKVATIDDISVFVIPLKPYKDEYLKWKEARIIVNNSSACRRAKSPTSVSSASIQSFE